METIRPETIQDPLVTQSSVQTLTSTVKGEEEEVPVLLGGPRERAVLQSRQYIIIMVTADHLISFRT